MASASACGSAANGSPPAAVAPRASMAQRGVWP
jgi:hypothetical protein